MKRFLPLLFLFAIAPQARADIRHAITSSAQLTVGAASTTTTRIPSTYSVSGTGVDTAIGDNAGQLSAGTISSGIYTPGTVVATQNASGGENFSFSSSYIQGDAIPAIGSGVDVSAGVVADMPAFGNTVVTSGGVAGNLAGSVLSSGVISITAGGAGSTATAQSSSEINVK